MIHVDSTDLQRSIDQNDPIVSPLFGIIQRGGAYVMYNELCEYKDMEGNITYYCTVR